MASGEVAFTGTMAYLIEPLERGFVMMMEMVNGTRLHSGVAGAGALRRAVVEATLHARERRAFGRALAEQPLVAETLADLIADSAATTSLMLAAAHALDQTDRPESARDEAVLSRLLIALLKRYATVHGVQGAQAAMELRGGNGYIEDWPNARLLRDAEVQVIWEGGVNMVSFDVLRAVEREDAWPIYAGAVERELALAAAPDTALLGDALHRALDRLNRLGERIGGWSREAREIAAPRLAETMAALYAAALLGAEASFAFERSDDEGALALATARRYHDRFLGPALDALARHANTDPRSTADAANLIAAAVVR